MPGTGDVTREIAREHDEIDRLCVRISMLHAGNERDECVRDACALFVAHVNAEERLLFEAMRRYLPDGSNVVTAQRLLDCAVLRTIQCCLAQDVEPDERDVLVGQLVIGIQVHVERYDCVLLPAVLRRCPLAVAPRPHGLRGLLHHG